MFIKVFINVSTLGSSDFNELLWIATDFNLIEFKNDVERFLIETNTCQLMFKFDKNKLTVLKLADNYGLNELRSSLLGEENIILSNVTQSVEFLNLTNSSKFEILKSTFIKRFKESSFAGVSKELALVDLKFILNFLGLIIHENRTVDLAVKNNQPGLFEDINSPKECIQMLQSKEQSPNEIVLNVEHGKKQLYVDCFTLTQNSPVLKELLKKNSKEEKKSLDFPQRSVSDMIQFIAFLKETKNIKGK